ncbi:RnfABCDGE type electron transport complex subunit D [Gynuella sp.]|uniref:RnfABCDGE type electron transport complex subunit D n=1 Tax=Gynuella sp. TaxID=2969146 RepID=UPI003D0FF5EA
MTIVNLVSAPHAHDRSSINRIMAYVCLALVPGTAFCFYIFGWPAINLWLFSVATAIGTEYVMLKLRHQSTTRLLDWSAVLTGWLLALCLPPWAPWWIAVFGSVFAVSIGKHLYGGLGQNLFNPAMLARTALLISFPVPMTTWAHATPIFSPNAPGFWQGLQITFGVLPLADGMTGATALGALKTALTQNIPAQQTLHQFSIYSSGLGLTSGSMGETSALLMLIGGIWLLLARVISWHIPVTMLTTVVALATFFHHLNPALYPPATFHLLSGGLMLGAFFIATDPVTSPAGKGAQIIFAAGCGGLTFLIRTWGGYPEAVAFSVLMMNALTPLLDQYLRPRIYGRRRSGQPLTTRQKR